MLSFMSATESFFLFQRTYSICNSLVVAFLHTHIYSHTRDFFLQTYRNPGLETHTKLLTYLLAIITNIISLIRPSDTCARLGESRHAGMYIRTVASNRQTLTYNDICQKGNDTN